VKKLSHEKVDYRLSTFKTKRCGTCSMYIAKIPLDCTLVEQPIRPADVCNRFQPKKGAANAERE
jgi:hypothetical protein